MWPPGVFRTFSCLCPEQSRCTGGLVAMGSSSSRLGIPQGKGPEAVGCTDLMVDHGAQVGP